MTGSRRPCLDDQWCPQNSTAPQQCPAGFLCPNSWAELMEQMITLQSQGDVSYKPGDLPNVDAIP